MLIIISIATFNVQQFDIIPLSNENTQITCTFAYNSYANGCYVILNNTDYYNVMYITIHKLYNKDTSYTTLYIPSGNYSVTVFDIVNGTVNSEPSQSLNYIVSIVSISGQLLHG